MHTRTVIVLHSQVRHGITEHKIRQIDSSPRLRGLFVEHCFVLDPSEWKGHLIDNIGFSLEVCDSLLSRLYKKIRELGVDIVLVHGVQAFTASGERNLQKVFSTLMSRYPDVIFVLPRKDFILDWLISTRPKDGPPLHPRDPGRAGIPRDERLERWIESSFVTNTGIPEVDALAGMI